MKRNYLVPLLLTLLYPAISAAQVPTGTPPFGSFGGSSADVINLANLNVHITVPVLNKAGRGLPFTYNLSYDTSVWYPVGSSGSQNWQAVNDWGWAGQTEPAVGYLTFSSSTTWCYTIDHGVKLPTGTTTYRSNWTYHDLFRIAHAFSGTTSQQTGTCGSSTTSFTSTATDGSGFTLQATGVSGTLTSRSGEVLNVPIGSPSGSATKTDSNGNEISVSSSEVFTDALGTTALSVSGSSPNPITFTYTSPNGASVAYTMKFSAYTVQTNFGCSGISEYGPTSNSLVSEIDLPDGTKYSFSYEGTPGHAGNVTGRLASVTFPTGGTISYSYTGANNGIVCADGSAAGLTRTTPDGVWTYARTAGTGAAYTTTVTDPQGNQTVIQFQGIYETERQVYQGLSTSGTLLKTVNTCYNGNTTNCTGTAVALPITQRTAYLVWPGGLESEINFDYNSFGLVTEADQYGYASGAPGALVRKTLVSYASLGNGIVDRPATITVQNSAGSTIAQTTYSYDQGTVTSTSGTPQHVSVSGSRGNPTTISYLVQGSTTLSRTFTYYDTGTPQTATDVNGAATTFVYGSGSCGNSFVTSISLPLSLSRSQAWNCTGGVLTSVTDENGQTTSYTYNDADFWRPNAATDPASNTTSLTYTDPTSVESSLVFNSNSSTADVLNNLDSLGRSHVTQRRQSPSSSYFDSVETDYDSLGRPSRVTLPYSGTAGQTNSSGPGISTTYDALSRPTQSSDSGGGSVTFGYPQNDLLATFGPAPSGENTKRRQFEYDGLGRLTSVCEVTSATGSGTCGQTSSQTGYWTKYTYDALGDVTGVTQNAQSGAIQTRSYSYDGLGRMTSETEAESGTTTYFYDSASGCASTSSGDLVKKLDAVGNTICYAYDALHRVTSVTYSGPYATGTPNKYFVYDSATVNNVAMANAKGRLAEAYTATCSTCSKITDLGFSHSVRGEVSDVYESTPHSGGYYHVNATFWANGAVDQLSGLPGLPAITYGVDGEGRPSSASAASGQNPATSTAYNVASLPTALNLGSGDSDAFEYDANTDRMTQYQANINGQSIIGQLTWNANGTLGTLKVTDPFNAGNTQTCGYGYDDLARIASANCGSVWAQTFSYDAFGNITKSGSMSFQPTYSSSTNRMVSLPGFTPSYDANGNVLNDSFQQYTWDAAGRPVTIGSVALSYDALGRMVEQNNNGSYTEIVYSPAGGKLALMNGQTIQKAFVALPAGATAVYSSSGLSYYRHADWLGSSRFASTPGRAMYFDVAYAPFGEPYAQAGTSDLSFTGENQDTAGGLYDFAAREFSIQGRWPSPDPAGLAAADLRYPQTLNRYAYVGNNPLSFTDPTGLKRALLGLGGGGFGGLNPAFFYFGYYIWVGGSFGDPFSSLSFTLNLATSDLLSSESTSGGGSSSSAGSLLGGLFGANFLDDSGSSIAASPGDTGNPSGSCVYLNASGTGVESIDQNSSVSECGATGGVFAPGTLTDVSTDPNSNQVTVTSVAGPNNAPVTTVGTPGQGAGQNQPFFSPNTCFYLNTASLYIGGVALYPSPASVPLGFVSFGIGTVSAIGGCL